MFCRRSGLLWHAGVIAAFGKPVPESEAGHWSRLKCRVRFHVTRKMSPPSSPPDGPISSTEPRSRSIEHGGLAATNSVSGSTRRDGAWPSRSRSARARDRRRRFDRDPWSPVAEAEAAVNAPPARRYPGHGSDDIDAIAGPGPAMVCSPPSGCHPFDDGLRRARILAAGSSSDSEAENHIKNALSAVRAWRDEHRP